jgi:hypothetical protein
MFSFTEITTIKINENMYHIHNCILDQMDIFKVMHDTENIGTRIFEITWPISQEIINKIFMCMYKNDFSIFKKQKQESMNYCLETVSFMKYLGINEKNIIIACDNMTPLHFLDFCIACDKTKFHSEIKYIYRKLYSAGKCSNVALAKQTIKEILINNFPIDFKKEIIKDLIKHDQNIVSNFNIIFAITQIYSGNENWKQNKICNETITLDYIKEFYKIFGFKTISYVITHDKFRITQIKINGENIEINNLISECLIPGTIGVNISKAIIEHLLSLLFKTIP